MNDSVDALVVRGHGLQRQARALFWGLLLGLGAGVHARTCEELKADIAEGMGAAGLRGYSLQIVPAGTPLAGAKVVGTCMGGARKVVYRRYALPQAQPLVSEAATPTAQEPSPELAAAPAPAPIAAPATPVPRKPSAPEPKPSAQAVPAPAPEPVVTPAPTAAPQALALQAPVLESASTPAPLLLSQVAEPAPAAAPAVAVAATTTPASQSAEAPPPTMAGLVPGFLAGRWPWLGGLALLLLGVFWRWRASGVDAAGLPRGPRL